MARPTTGLWTVSASDRNDPAFDPAPTPLSGHGWTLDPSTEDRPAAPADRVWASYPPPRAKWRGTAQDDGAAGAL